MGGGIGDEAAVGAMGGAVAIYTPAESGVGLGGLDVAVGIGEVVGSGVGSSVGVEGGNGAEVGTAVEIGTSVGATARDMEAGVGMDVGVSGETVADVAGSEVGSTTGAVGLWTACS